MFEGDEYKQKIQSSFDLASHGYDSPGLRFFSSSAAHLVETLNLNGNENLIDIATGTGHVAIRAAEALKGGAVVGVDLSEGMLGVARRKADEKSLPNVTFRRLDFEKMDFEENSFDVACCAFGLFFLDDMARGLARISKVVKPGGKVALASFTKSMMEPLSQKALDMLETYGIKPPALSWKKLDTPEKINDLIDATKLGDVKIESKQIGYYLKDSGQWWEILWNSGYRGLLNQLDENDLMRFKRDHLKEVDQLAGGDGIWLDVEALYAVATNS
ncbi:hypothetical protein MNBD_NITROSPINAE02-1218 [hydrothermal vent metagenome]|uniref:Methyltransferase domain-containing protein n=1 Tax=hydrothermal vent metagenome TaxID=652676 RepID=A0A3B1C677_9ZZZZ